MITYGGTQNPAVGVQHMSKLKAFGRPWVEFDVRNKEHRREFTRYLQTDAWGECPYRFFVEGQIMPEAAIRRQLLEYYTIKEFGDLSR